MHSVDEALDLNWGANSTSIQMIEEDRKRKNFRL